MCPFSLCDRTMQENATTGNNKMGTKWYITKWVQQNAEVPIGQKAETRKPKAEGNPKFASSFLNCMQNGFNFLLRATSSWVFFGHTLVRQDRTFISTCASRNIGTAAREGPVFREIVTPADGEALSHFGSGSASLGFRTSDFTPTPPAPSPDLSAFPSTSASRACSTSACSPAQS